MTSGSNPAQTAALEEPLSEEQIDALPMYEWDVANIGDAAPPFVYEITAESIADYCQAVRNDNPIYVDGDAAASGPFGTIVGPPTFLIKAARHRRNEVMHAQGYASPEEKQDRSTPFAKCELKLHKPIRLGDTITSTVELEDKYERRGNQFFTWRIRARNQDDELVGEYAYTIIWRRAPKDESAPKAPRPAPVQEAEVEIPEADQLPIVTKHETQEAIDQYSELTRVRPRQQRASVHSDPEFARRSIFGGTVNMGAATAAYCAESLEKKFGPEALMRPGARLEYKGIRPVYAGSELTISGGITERNGSLVECELKAHNQDGQLCGVATATVVVDETTG
jgi:acyl dehydratase